MDVLILFTRISENQRNQFNQFFLDLDINPIFYLIDESWEDQENFIHDISKNKYFFIIASDKDLHDKWFKFVLGLCLGKECQPILYLPDPESDVPGSLTFIKGHHDLEEIRSKYKELYLEWKKENEVRLSKEKISQLGLYQSPYHFFLTIEKDDRETVNLFLKSGFSPDTLNSKGVHPFNYAVRLGHMEIAQILIDKGCDIFAVSKDNGNNALMDAASEGCMEMARFLIEKGIDLNVQSRNEQTALMLAVSRNNGELVKLLLDSGADRNIKDVLGMTAQKYAEILKFSDVRSLFNEE